MRPRQLFVLRHAKSSWDDPDVGDFDRPLAPRGQRDAARLAADLAVRGPVPELVLCSTARRTRETLAAVLVGVDEVPVVQFLDALYGASSGELLALLRQVPEATGSVLLVGHNPGLQELVLWLAGDGAGAARRQAESKFPTGALATINLGATAWADLAPGAARLDALVVPRSLPA
jgi:phosphohistidine phosphatase